MASFIYNLIFCEYFRQKNSTCKGSRGDILKAEQIKRKNKERMAKINL